MTKLNWSGLALIASGLLATNVASAQSRDPGWEFGTDVIYQMSQTVPFQGNTILDIDDDLGLDIFFGYRFNERMELMFTLDWNSVDYEATFDTFNNAGASTGRATVHGEYEAFTPKAIFNFNFLTGPITPYVNAGVGWSFIDTNIPTGRPSNVCYWDPWWGYVCGTVQNTKTTDGLQYQVGFGLRADVGNGYTMRLVYEKHWIDLGGAVGTPDLDQIRLGISYRY